MGTLTSRYPKSCELLTEVIEVTDLWRILGRILEFLSSRRVEKVHIEFGFVLDRDLKGEAQGQNQTVGLVDLESVIKRGLAEGTIEWGRGSDFVFRAVGADLVFMLCNDRDLHFASRDTPLLMELGRQIRSCGIRVYDSGKLI